MTHKISIREHRPEDVQALAKIYYNTVNQINIQHYTEEQVNAWTPALSLKAEGWGKKIPDPSPLLVLSEIKLLAFLSSN